MSSETSANFSPPASASPDEIVAREPSVTPAVASEVSSDAAVADPAPVEVASERVTTGDMTLETLEAYSAIGESPLLPPREPAGARLATFMGRHHTLLFVLCVAVLWAIVAAPSLWQRDAYRRGQLATADILAPHAAMLLDRAETERRQEEAAGLVPPVYDSDLSAQSRALAKLRVIAATARALAPAHSFAPQAIAQPAISASKVLSRTTQPFSSRSLTKLGQNKPAQSTLGRRNSQKAALNAPSIPLQRPFDRRIEALRQRLNANLETPMPSALSAQLAAIGLDRWALIERAARAGVGAVYVGGQIRSDVRGDLTAARERIDRAVQKARNEWPLSPNETTVAALMARFVARTPNLITNARATEKARQAARNEVRNVYLQVGANTPLIRARELITDDRFAQLQDMNLVAPRFDWRMALARLALCLVMVALSAGFLKYFTPRLLARPTALWLSASVPLLFIGAFRLILWVPHADAAAIPLAATAAMLLTVLIDARVGMLAGFVVAAFCSLMTRADLGLLLAAALSSWTGTLGVASIASRGQLFRAGALLTVANGVLAAMLGVFRDAPGDDIISMILWGAASGALSVVAMAGLAMSLERPFGITTHLRLLELLSPDEITLQRMQAEAPGTYTHSMMVGSLSEAAAKAIEGADPLLCRVGGIYHDIGKLRRPHCFIENQGGENIHDRLSPQLSSLVILAHVKDGLELGRAIRLPQPVMDIIAQHHGCGIISYFYERARLNANVDASPDAAEIIVDEKLFRYSGPRPQSKEAAIVMLADSIEASARSLPDLTIERLQEHIAAMIAQRLGEGELSDSDLTLRDLQTVESTFAHVLRGVLHQRIQYPDPARELREATQRETERRETAQRDAAQREAAQKTAVAKKARDKNRRPRNEGQNERPALLVEAEIAAHQQEENALQIAAARPSRRSRRRARAVALDAATDSSADNQHATENFDEHTKLNSEVASMPPSENSNGQRPQNGATCSGRSAALSPSLANSATPGHRRS